MHGYLLPQAESHPCSTLLLNYAAFAAEDSKSFISLALGNWKCIISYSVVWYSINMCEQNCYENIHMFFYLNTIYWVNSPEKTHPPVTKATGAAMQLDSTVSQFWIFSFSVVKWEGCLCCVGIHTRLHIIYNYKNVRIYTYIYLYIHI